MKIVQTVKNQTIFDIAVQEYGNAAAWEEILNLNPGLKNDYSSALAAQILYYPEEFDLAFPIMEGTKVFIETESDLANAKYLREIASKVVISFEGID